MREGYDYYKPKFIDTQPTEHMDTRTDTPVLKYDFRVECAGTIKQQLFLGCT